MLQELRCELSACCGRPVLALPKLLIATVSCQVSLHEFLTSQACNGLLYTVRDVQHVFDIYNQAKGLS